MPGRCVEANENESSDMIGGFEHATHLHRLARLDIASDRNDTESTSYQQRSLCSREPALSARCFLRLRDDDRENKLLVGVREVERSLQRFQFAAGRPLCHFPAANLSGHTTTPVSSTRCPVDQIACLVAEVFQKGNHVVTNELWMREIRRMLFGIVGQHIRYRDFSGITFPPVRPVLLDEISLKGFLSFSEIMLAASRARFSRSVEDDPDWISSFAGTEV